MKDALLRLYIRARVLREDSGQDLVEYALVVALISLAAVGGMKTLAGGINTAFSTLGSKMGTYVT
jgi:pilus assembly protein Flp/PilA